MWEWKSQWGGSVSTLRLGHCVFSDSIIVWSPKLKLGGQWAYGFFLTLAQLVLFGLRAGLPIRVGVAFGEFIADTRRSVYLGRALVDAYETEQQQDWIGGAYHPSCHNAPPSGLALVILAEKTLPGGMWIARGVSVAMFGLALGFAASPTFYSLATAQPSM